MPCDHSICTVDMINEFGAQVTCILCNSARSLNMEQVERHWIAFESTEPSSWEHQTRGMDREILLVSRSIIRRC